MSTRRHGSTLVELALALAVLAVALVIVLESLVHVSSFAGLQARQGDLDEQCRRISERLHQDLATTAWFVGVDRRTHLPQRLFPDVTKGGPLTLGDELEFLRLRSERTASATPTDCRVEAVDFLHDPPVPMDLYARARGVRSLILNPAWTGSGGVQAQFAIPTWEAVTPTVSFDEATQLDRLRHFRFTVRPDLEVTGRGILFREHRDSEAEDWITDERIADNLVSISFATNREMPWLNANQIMVSATLQADDLRTGQARARRSLQLIIAMRCGFTE